MVHMTKLLSHLLVLATVAGCSTSTSPVTPTTNANNSAAETEIVDHDEQLRKAGLAEEQKHLQDQQEQKAKEVLARKEEERRERWNNAGKEIRQFVSADAEFTASALSKDGRYVGGVCRGDFPPFDNPNDFGDTSVYVWETSTGRQLHRFRPKPMDTLHYAFSSIDFTPDGNLVAVGREDGTVRIWNVESGNEVHFLAKRNLSGGISEHVNAVVFSPDGRSLLAVGHGIEVGKTYYSVRLWDVSTGKVAREFPGHSDSVLCAAISPDGKYAVTGGRDRIAILWNVSEGKEARLFDAHIKAVTATAITPDGSYVLTGSEDRTVRMWHLDSGRLVHLFNLEGPVNSISCAKNRPLALVGRSMPPDAYLGGTIDSNPVMLDLKGWAVAKLPVAFMRKPLENIKAVVSPDGKVVLSNAKQRSRVRGKEVDTYYLTLRDLPE